jgi:hypothetical protein
MNVTQQTRPLLRHATDETERIMDITYLSLCGVVWSQFGREDAGHELIRALSISDPEVRALARAMLGGRASAIPRTDQRSRGAQ